MYPIVIILLLASAVLSYPVPGCECFCICIDFSEPNKLPLPDSFVEGKNDNDEGEPQARSGLPVSYGSYPGPNPAIADKDPYEVQMALDYEDYSYSDFQDGDDGGPMDDRPDNGRPINAHKQMKSPPMQQPVYQGGWYQPPYQAGPSPYNVYAPTMIYQQNSGPMPPYQPYGGMYYPGYPMGMRTPQFVPQSQAQHYGQPSFAAVPAVVQNRVTRSIGSTTASHLSSYGGVSHGAGDVFNTILHHGLGFLRFLIERNSKADPNQKS